MQRIILVIIFAGIIGLVTALMYMVSVQPLNSVCDDYITFTKEAYDEVCT